jgi:hypothetical protein
VHRLRGQKVSAELIEDSGLTPTIIKQHKRGNQRQKE